MWCSALSCHPGTTTTTTTTTTPTTTRRATTRIINNTTPTPTPTPTPTHARTHTCIAQNQRTTPSCCCSYAGPNTHSIFHAAVCARARACVCVCVRTKCDPVSRRHARASSPPAGRLAHTHTHTRTQVTYLASSGAVLERPVAAVQRRVVDGDIKHPHLDY